MIRRLITAIIIFSFFLVGTASTSFVQETPPNTLPAIPKEVINQLARDLEELDGHVRAFQHQWMLMTPQERAQAIEQLQRVLEKLNRENPDIKIEMK